MLQFFGQSIEAWGENIWLGVTVENPDNLWRIDYLLDLPAVVRFVSFEPLLGLIHYENIECLDWVICGGESGPGSRPMHPDWPRLIRDQCQAASVPFFFKQWGDWAPVSGHHPCNCYFCFDNPSKTTPNLKNYNGLSRGNMYRTGKKKAGRMLDGREWNEYPQ